VKVHNPITIRSVLELNRQLGAHSTKKLKDLWACYRGQSYDKSSLTRKYSGSGELGSGALCRSAGGSNLCIKTTGSGRTMFFRGGGLATVQFTNVLKVATKDPVAPAVLSFTNS